MPYKKGYRKNNLSRKVNFLSKQIRRQKPEIKHHETDYDNLIDDTQTNKLLMDIPQGVGTGARIGEKIKIKSYYGVFYLTLNTTNGAPGVPIRVVHYFTDDGEPLLRNTQGGIFQYDDIVQDKGYIIREDRLLTLSSTGRQVIKLVIKGRFKYPINMKWNELTTEGWRPRLCFVCNQSNSLNFPTVKGKIKYYFTDP